MNVDEIRTYAEQGLTRQQIADNLGLSYNRVSTICRENGICPERKKRCVTPGLKLGPRKKTIKIIELREKGLKQKDIASLVGCSIDHVQSVCRDYKLTKEQKLTESQVAELVSRSGFDYVSGYAGTKKNIVVRCRTCGRTFERQAHIFIESARGTLGHKNECPLCRVDRQRQEKEKREQEQRELKKREAQMKAQQKAEQLSRKVNDQLARRLANRVCKNCGTEFCIELTGYDSEFYCSKKCQQRWHDRIKNEKRMDRLKQRPHDTDITLEKLFKRDGGVCYICGGLCDWSDIVEQDGTMVAGDSYPSVDHVKPVSKGGTHTWSNIRLACRACNTLKGWR